MTNVGELRAILQSMMNETKEELESSTLPFQKEVCEKRFNILKKCNDDLMDLGIEISKRLMFEAMQFDLTNFLEKDHPIFKGEK